MNLYIYSYNNYYNRQVKKAGDLISNYNEWLHYGPIQGVYGFTPGDGVNTKQIIGSNASMYDGKGDYLIAFNPNTNEIDSRWFIIDVNRTRAGQWELILHRDLMVDYYDLIIDSPMFIEKATVPSSSPFVFNSENISVNQIKQAEYLLENNLKTPWVVAYLSRQDGEGNYNSFNGSFIYEGVSQAADYELESLDDYKFSTFFRDGYTVASGITFKCDYYNPNAEYPYKWGYIELGSGTFKSYLYGYDTQANTSTLPVKETGVSLSLSNPSTVYGSLISVYNTYNTEISGTGVTYNSISNIGNTAGLNILAAENGKIIKVGDYYWRIKTKIQTEAIAIGLKRQISYGTDLYSSIKTLLIDKCGLTTNSSTKGPCYVQLPQNGTKITLDYERIEVENSISYNFSYTDGGVTTDAPYEIIATPLYDTTFIVENNVQIKSLGSYGYQWFQSIARSNSTKVYDVQIVPYIPIDTADISIYKRIVLSDTSGTYAIALQLPQSSFNKLIDISSKIKLNSNVKIGSETEIWRLTSPNGIGNFDFNPYKNKEFSTIEIDCTLLPINPYIKVNPLFSPNGLYGGDYNDYRGLICGGDFSISLTSSDWATYQQQNKNFQAVFDREIQSMDFKNKIAKEQDIWSAISGSFSGAAGGALAGAMMGGGYGAIAGGIVGGASSLGAGIADISINQQLRDEAKSYTEDMFQLNLGNIKARANTLTKTTSYNINNKYFPYIEYFSCTEDEKEAVANKIAWNGMTLGIIGILEDYINNSWSYNGIIDKGYVKGQLIRLEFPIDHKKKEHSEDFHVVNAISGELNKGVYIK